MIIMMLSNNKGISLVILIVAMTLIAILGASFVSLVGSKQKGFLYQTDSYRALNHANAGVEYAIRYAGDNIDSTGANQNDFFHSAVSYIPVVNTIPDATNLNNAAQWKRFDFAGGQFYISYYLNTSTPYVDDFDENKILYSVGIMRESKRVVKLKKFLTYASPTSTGLGRLNLVPNNRPYVSGNYLVVPVIHLYDTNTTTPITISSIQFMGDFTNNLTKELRDIRLRDTSLPPVTTIYSYSSYPNPPCSSYPAPTAELPCRQFNHIEIPDNGPTTQPLSLSGVTMSPYSIRWIFFRFTESGNDLRGSYTITFNTLDDSLTDSSTITFSIP
jgi:hypothetical protein